MKPLIDGDILRYEIASCGQFLDEETGEQIIRPFDAVADLFESRMEEIMKLSDATEEPTIFLTRTSGDKLGPYKPNFRIATAVSKPYKGTRKEEKPFHFWNLTHYMLARYQCELANGLEADDLMGAFQTRALGQGKDTIICTRDKDLRMVPGWQMGWEVGRQPSFGPEFVEDPGYLKLSGDKVMGVGVLFFFYQMLVGDSVDNIPGLPGCGPKKAWKLLGSSESEEEALGIVRGAYEEKYGEGASEKLSEQSKLLWIAREIDGGGVRPYPGRLF